MNAAAAQASRILAVGMIRRFFPAFAQFRQIIADGELGSLVSWEYREGHKFEWEVTTPAAFRPRAEGGTGVLFDIGPHVVDHLAWTFGDLRVIGYSDDALQGIESNLTMEVESALGPGSVHLSWDMPQCNELRVVGSRAEAILRIDRFDQLAVGTRGRFVSRATTVQFPADTHPTPQAHVAPRTYAQAIFCQLVQTVRAITLGEPPAVDGHSGERCITVLESALSQARPMDMPWLDAAEQIATKRLHWTVAR
jgi:predicted dehydrogenase